MSLTRWVPSTRGHAWRCGGAPRPSNPVSSRPMTRRKWPAKYVQGRGRTGYRSRARHKSPCVQSTPKNIHPPRFLTLRNTDDETKSENRRIQPIGVPPPDFWKSLCGGVLEHLRPSPPGQSPPPPTPDILEVGQVPHAPGADGRRAPDPPRGFESIQRVAPGAQEAYCRRYRQAGAAEWARDSTHPPGTAPL